MKKISRIKGLVLNTLAFAVILPALCSCRKEFFSFTPGSNVYFAVSTGAVATKASYSGAVADNKERIDWEEGDLLRIYCAVVSEPAAKYADYEVKEGSVSASGAISNAQINVKTGDIGLRWGATDAQHNFYAVYPSPALTGTGSIGDGTMTGSIPEVQAPVSLNAIAVVSDPDFTAVPDMLCEYMVAYQSVKNDEDADEKVNGDGAVFLKFKPIVTAIEFTITNDQSTDAVLNIKNIQLTSAAHDIAGTFSANLNGLNVEGTAYPECTSTSTGKTVTMDFTNIPDYDYSGNSEISGSKKYVSVEKGQTLRFTMFLKPEYSDHSPVDVDDLTFKVVKADDSWVSTKLAYNDAGKTGVAFPCHKKSYVSGILVPEGAQWSVKFSDSDSVIESWTTPVEKSLDL